MILVQLFAIFVLLTLIYLLLRPIINGAVYFPTSMRNLNAIVALAEVQPGQKVADLGSGDGRIVMAFARLGAEAHGYEINPLLVWKSKRAIRRAGLQRNAFVHWKSMWRADLTGYKAVTVYGIPYIMNRLGKKLDKELVPGAKIVSNIFPLPDRTPTRTADQKIYVYTARGELRNA